MIKRRGFAVEFHISGIDSWSEDPRVVEIALAAFDEEDLEVVVEVCKSSSNDAARASTSTNDDIYLIWNRHFEVFLPSFAGVLPLEYLSLMFEFNVRERTPFL